MDEQHASETKKGLIQFIKFGLVGVSNTVVDFTVLNVLIWITGTTKGVGLAMINIVSFTAAVTNSYIWNKYWTFKQKEKEHLAGEISKFLAISIIGAGLNTMIVYLIATAIDPLFGLSDVLWANVAKMVAVGAVLVWNFFGYKFWAFKTMKKQGPSPERPKSSTSTLQS